jgi:glutaminyl-tRNA synthetase
LRRWPAGRPRPKQYEFARLNLTYVITSKRKLAQLVNEGKVSGWDDPRMPTIVGLRRRGYTPAAIQMFAERIGVTKSDSWIDYSTLEGCLREDLEAKAHRGMAVLDPVKLVLTNWDEVMGAGHLEPCTLPALPHPSPKVWKAPCATSPSARKCGLSAKTLPKCRPRATSAFIRPGQGRTVKCCPATLCA